MILGGGLIMHQRRRGRCRLRAFELLLLLLFFFLLRFLDQLGDVVGLVYCIFKLAHEKMASLTPPSGDDKE